MGLISQTDNTAPTPWPDISSSDTFKSLNPSDQEALRNKYYDKVVSPAKPQGIDDTAFRNGFLQKSIEHDYDNNIFDSQQAATRLAQNKISSDRLPIKLGGYVQSIGTGIETAGANMVSGVVKTAADIDQFIGITSPDEQSKLYNEMNQATGKINKEASNVANPTLEKAAEISTDTLPFFATAPETVAIKGAGMLKNAAVAGLQLAPAMGATAYGTSNAPTEEQRISEGETNTLLTTPLTVAGSGMLAALSKLGGTAIDKLAPIFSENARMGKLSSSMADTNAQLGTSNEQVAKNIESGQAQTAKVSPQAQPSTSQLSGNNPTLLGLQNSPALSSAKRQALDTKETEALNTVAGQVQGQNTAPSNTEINTAGNISRANTNDTNTLDDINTAIKDLGPEQATNNKELLANQMTNVADRSAQTSEPYRLNSKLSDNRATYEANNIAGQEALDVIDDKAIKPLQTLANNDPKAAAYLDTLGLKLDDNGIIRDTGQGTLSIENMRKLANYVSNLPPETFEKAGLSASLKKPLADIGNTINAKLDSQVVDPVTGMHASDVGALQTDKDLSTIPAKNPNNLQAVVNPDTNYKAALESNNEQVNLDKAPINAGNKANTPTNFNVEGNTKPYTIGTNDRPLTNIRNEAIENKEVPTVWSDRFTPGQNGAQAVKDYLGQIKGADDVVGNTIVNKIMTESTKSGEFNPDTAKTLLTDTNTGYKSHIDSLEPSTAASITRRVNALSDIYSSANEGLEARKPFADWLANINDDKVYSDALKTFNGVNELRNNVANLSKQTQDGVNDLLRQKYFEQNNVISSTRAPDAQGNPTTKLKVNPQFLKDINTVGTENYKIFNSLYDTPKDAKAVKDTLDLAERYQTENGNAKLNQDRIATVAKDVGKAAFFHMGGRLGTSAYIDNAFATLFSQKYGEVIDKVLNDPEYAKSILRMSTTKDEGAVTKLLQNYNLTVPAISGIMQNNSKHMDNSSPTTTSVRLGKSQPMSDVFTAVERYNDNTEGGSNAFKDFEQYKNETLPPADRFNDDSHEPDMGVPSGYNEPSNQKKSNILSDMMTLGKTDTISRNLKLEGGYVNNPNDSGGATNMGITLRTLKQVKPDATTNDIKHLTPEMATSIYDKLYWTPNHVEQMPEGVQDVAFDSFVQHGDTMGAKLIQRALANMGQPVQVDGKIGEDTIAAMNRVDPTTLRTNILSSREQFYRGLAANNPSQKQFLNGWLNRLDALT